MKRKPLWGLWLLMIIAPVAVFFGVKEKRKLRDKVTGDEITFDDAARSAAAQGKPHISKLRFTPLPNNAGYLVRLSFFNSSPVAEIGAIISSGSSEVIQNTGQSVLKDGDDLDLNCYGRSYCSTTVFNIKKQRQKPIHVHLDWFVTNAAGQNVESRKDVVITPQMKDK